MPETPRGYPFPLVTDPPAGHTQIHDLALAVDGDVGGLSLVIDGHTTAINSNTADIDNIEQTLSKLGVSGKRLIVGTAAPAVSGTGGATVLYGYTFASPPIVVAVVGDESAAAGYIQLSHSGVTTTSFAVRVLNRSGAPLTSGAVRINYVALGTAS